MNLHKCALGGILVLGSSLCGATVVNDGTTADGLLRRAPESLFVPPAMTTLEPGGADHLVGGLVQPTDNFPVLHTAWYSETYAVTGSVYQVSAQFRLAGLPPAGSGGGVVGAFDEATGVGLTFSVKTAAVPYVGVEIYNFETGARPRGWLYNLEGVEVHPDFTEAWRASVDGVFQETDFVLLRVSVAAPEGEDLEVLPAATARVTAEALQDHGLGFRLVAPRLEYLVTLPPPASGEQRFGYYGVYNSLVAHTGPLGHYRDLRIEGEFGLGNQRPTVTLVEPVKGTVIAPGETIALVAEAADPDPGDRVVKVDFYAGAFLVGTAAEEPYSVTWSSDSLGPVELTAVATDTRGASRVSAPVVIEIAEIWTEPPALSVRREGDLVVLQWDRVGTQLQASVDGGGSWTNVATAGTEHRELITGTMKLWRLAGAGVPDAAVLSRSVVNGLLTLSWSQSGYELQSSENLSGGWTMVPTLGNQHTEPMTGLRKFFRLSR